MDPTLLSLVVAFAIITVLFLAGVQIGVTLALGGMIGAVVFSGNWTSGISLLLIQSMDVTGSYSLMVIPLFIALGSLAAASGITTDLFSAFYRWFGRISGGIAVATIATCASMAAITGSGVAVAAAMTRIALPELRRFKYSEELSVGAIATGGTIAIMIPPSITLVIYAVFAEQSVGKLLIAGVLPGLLTSLFYALLIVVRCYFNPALGPSGPIFSRREKLAAAPSVLPFLSIVVAIIVGMLTGVWTPVEAAAIGVVLVLLMGLWRRSQTLRTLLEGFMDAAVTSASVLVVVIGSLVFSNFLAVSGVSEIVTEGILALDLSPVALFSMFIFVYLVLGCLMEVTSILALTIPLFMPVVKAVGWDPVWFGVVVVSMMEVAAVTPPVGLNLYAVKATAPDVPLATIYRGAFQFWLMNIVVVLLLYMYPEIALYLPNMM
ncbi:MAG: TRAP transporter large permease [Pseudomonadota bacterium]